MLLAAPLLLGARAIPASIDYSISPVIEHGALTALTVEIRLTGDADGETRLALPSEWAGTDKLWQSLSDLTIEGGRIALDGDDARRIMHAPNARLVVRYRVFPEASADPGPDFEKARPVIRPGWFFFHGEGVFAAIEGRDTAPARFTWRGWPANWRVASDLDHLRNGKGTVADISESAAIGAIDLRIIQRTVDGAPFRLATRGSWSFTPEALADRIVAVMHAENSYWSDPGRAFFVPVAPLVTDGSSLSVHGTGRIDGFSLAATTNYRLEEATRFLAHEYMHNWIGRELGDSASADEPTGYWLTEGFTDFIAARALVRSGLWSLEDYATEKNQVLYRLATSPVRALPNAKIPARFWSDYAVQKLPYDRGNLFALWADEQLRAVGGIDAILRTQRKMARSSRALGQPASALFPTIVTTVADSNFSAAFARHIERGEPVELPASLAGGCLNVETVGRTIFDRGFDIDATMKADKIIKGVDPTSAAFAAGLRNGMKLVRREGGEVGNPDVEITYRVVDNGTERLIRYWPTSRQPVQVQQLKVPQLTPTERAACAAKL